MASAVQIANSALTKLGESRIISIDDDVKPAREIKAIYDLRRDALLRSYNWNFAMKRVSLPALSTAPEWGYSLQYQLPSDCLRPVQVGDVWYIPGLQDFMGGPDEEPFKIEGQAILTNMGSQLKLRYIRRVTNSGEFDAMFTEAFACDLACNVAEALTQSTQKREFALIEKRDAIKMALRSNAIELPPNHIADDSWVAARFT
jgi:hypothetical protein